MNNVRFLIVCLCASGLSACLSDRQNYFTRYSSNQSYMYTSNQFYPQTYNGTANYGEYAREVAVPESYYTGSYRSPTSHKDVDRNWVSGQNPNGYTIVLGESKKASKVAEKLYKAPKKERMAEVEYYRDGNNYYKGVYGSYNNYQDAQKALNNLPSELKQTAGIKSWSMVQANMNEY